MAQPINPYVAGPPMQGGKGFFGRQDTLDWVVRGLRNPVANSLVLFGQRRIGKTTLLLQLERALSTDAFLPIYFDLQGQAARPLGQALADLADTVAEHIGLEPPDPEMFDDRGLFFSRTFLPQIDAAIGKNRRLVFLLDEFDVLDAATKEELPATATFNSLLRIIRRVMTSLSRPAFIFAVGRRIDDLELDFTASFKASLVREVWVLDQKSAEEMVRQAEANKTLLFTHQAIARILSLTNYHPYLTQLLCRQIWEQAYEKQPNPPPEIGVPEVEAAVPNTLDTVDQALVWLWDGLSLAEKIYAAGLAETVAEGEIISETRGMQVLTNHAARLCTREVELRAPRDLVRRRVLDLAGEQEHRFTIELFRRWIQTHKPLHEVKHELDRVDPLAEELFGIGQEFFRRSQLKAAVRYFRDALAANPHHFYARLRLGETLLQMNQPDKAVAELERTYEQDREEARLLLTRALVAQARAQTEAGDESSALAVCERALQISPQDQAAQKIKKTILMGRTETKARSHEQAEQWAEAATTYEQLIAQAPDEQSREKWKRSLERCQKENLLAHLFDEGLKALERKNWYQAETAFAKVVHARPHYAVDNQLAAQLLLQAILRKPIRKHLRLAVTLLAVTALVIVASVWYFRPWETPQTVSPVMLPEDWKHYHTYRLDTNGDNNLESVVLYYFDLPAETGGDSSPIGGFVYQPNHRNSSIFSRYELRPRGGDYLCECECTATMGNVLSGLSGSELIIRDRCDGEITRLSIFHWEPNEGQYLPKGHFSGSRIQVTGNSVTVSQRLPHRAQLALQQVYQSRDGETYYQSNNLDILVMSRKYELTFYEAEPANVTRSPYPEKVVLAFYNHYTDSRKASEYFTTSGWRQLEQCTTGQCGCTAAPSEIAHVRVTDLHSIGETGSNWASFEFSVVCEHRDGTSEAETSVQWNLVQQDGHWKLDSVGD
jgi:tetratricopeptide (TPR) repeat protein